MRQLSERSLLSRSVPPLPDHVLFEPRLFAWHFGIGSDGTHIDQLLYRGLKAAGAQTAQVRTDNKGRVFLSGGPTLVTGLPCTELTLEIGSSAEKTRLLKDGAPVSFHRLKEGKPLVRSSALLPATEDPVLLAFFKRHFPGADEVALCSHPEQFSGPIDDAMHILMRRYPELHLALQESLKSIVLFTAPDVNSFAALQMHGMIFLCMRRPPTVPFFLDGLAHQGGHVVFSEVTLDRPSYFLIPPDTSLGSVAGDRDPRTAYELLHGLFTEYSQLKAFDGSTDEEDYEAAVALEMSARFDCALERFERDLAKASELSGRLFSSRGMKFIEEFQDARSHYSERRPKAARWNVVEQPEDFDFEAFQRSQCSAASLIDSAQ